MRSHCSRQRSAGILLRTGPAVDSDALLTAPACTIARAPNSTVGAAVGVYV